jgi:MFS family permease
VACYVARLSPAMVSLAILLLVERHTGSFAKAGVATGAYAVAVGVCSPLVGRLMDRLGPTPVLSLAAALHPVALLAIVLWVEQGLGEFAVVVCALAGLTAPQTSAAARGLWALMLPEGQVRQAAYSLDAVSAEMAFIVGPLLVSLAVALADPAYAVLAGAGCAVMGALGIGLSPLVRGRPRSHPEASNWIGPLAAPGLVVLLVALLVISSIFGLVPVTVAAFTQEQGQPAAVGAMLALWSVGGVIGGVVYGGRRWHAPLDIQYLWSLALVAAGLLLLVAVRGPIDMGAVMLISGLAIVPCGSISLQLISLAAPPGMTSEAFSWLNTMNYVGFAAGNGLGGLLVDLSGERWAALTPSAAVLLGLAIVLLGRRWLPRSVSPA